MYSLFAVENILERGLKLFSSLFYLQWPKYFLTQSRFLIRIVNLVKEERDEEIFPYLISVHKNII